MKYAPIVDLRMRHAYHADGRCADFTLEPDDATRRFLKGCRWLTQASADGISVHAPTTADGRLALPWPKKQVLAFHLRLRNADFALFTDLDDLHAQPAPLFTSVGAKRAGSVSGQALRVLKLSTVPDAASLPPGVFARVEIVLPSSAKETAALHTYEIRFQPRSAKWRYYLVSPPAKACAYTLDYGPTATFVASVPGAADPVGQGLRAQHGAAARIDCFTSRTPLPCGDAAPAGLRLVGGIEARHLPAPHRLCRLDDAEPAFFCIVHT